MSQPYQSSPYAQNLEHILAALHTPEDEQEQSLPDEEPLPTFHVYPVEGGGVLFSPVPLEQDEDDEQEDGPLVIDSQPPIPRPRLMSQHPPHFLSFVLLLVLFLLLDAANSQLVSLLMPTVTITLTPVVRTLTLTSTAPLGRQLALLTLSQFQSVPTTGHGHQDARAASGTLTFYNGLATFQVVAAGKIFTGQDGVRVATDEPVTVPPANPPSLGATSVSAHTLLVGAMGNIGAWDINTALLNGLYVKNLTSFTGGQDTRDFAVVSRADLEQTAAHLKASVSASMTSTLQGQLASGESWLTPSSCTPSVRADHAVGEEAAHLTVMVSETCVAIAYRAEAVHEQATQLLTTQATRTLGNSYQPIGNVSVRVLHATVRTSPVWITFTGQGRWVYQLHPQHLAPLLLGKPRGEALHLLLCLPGIEHASITGIEGNALLPTDPQHLRFLEIVGP
jgi:hypothetical protein